MSLLRLAGCQNVARGMEYLSRRLDQILALLGLLPEPIRKGDAYTTTLPMALGHGRVSAMAISSPRCCLTSAADDQLGLSPAYAHAALSSLLSRL